MTPEAKARIERLIKRVEVFSDPETPFLHAEDQADAQALRDLLAAAEAGAQWKQEVDRLRDLLASTSRRNRTLARKGRLNARPTANTPCGVHDGVLYCYGGCGTRYEEMPCDLILPTRLWNRIATGIPFDEAEHSEQEGRGGVMCPSCIVQRLSALSDCSAVFADIQDFRAELSRLRLLAEAGEQDQETWNDMRNQVREYEQENAALVSRCDRLQAELSRLRPLAEAGERLKALAGTCRVFKASMFFVGDCSNCSHSRKDHDELTSVLALLPAEAPVYPRMHDTSVTYAPVDPEEVADALGAVPAEAPAPTKEEQ